MAASAKWYCALGRRGQNETPARSVARRGRETRSVRACPLCRQVHDQYPGWPAASPSTSARWEVASLEDLCLWQPCPSSGSNPNGAQGGTNRGLHRWAIRTPRSPTWVSWRGVAARHYRPCSEPSAVHGRGSLTFLFAGRLEANLPASLIAVVPVPVAQTRPLTSAPWCTTTPEPPHRWIGTYEVGAGRRASYPARNRRWNCPGPGYFLF